MIERDKGVRDVDTELFSFADKRVETGISAGAKLHISRLRHLLDRVMLGLFNRCLYRHATRKRKAQ